MINNNVMQLKKGYNIRRKRWILMTILLLIIAIGLCITMMLMGNTTYSPQVIIKVLLGEQIKGATFTIWQVRLPRMLAGVLAGLAFGISGNVFQTMLRNPLASPDIIGVTSGSGVAAVLCILVFGTGKGTASTWSVIAGLGVAGLIYLLSSINGFSSGKLILIGIGIQAMMKAVISYLLLKASQFDVAVALRWLSGSLNGIQLKQLPVLFYAVLILGIVIVFSGRQLKILELGEQIAIVLGVRTNVIRVVLVVSTVCMIAIATAVTGPIACVTFLAGPIAVKLVGEGNTGSIPSGLVGVILVLVADLVGQFMLDTRFPVGVITGILGAPYLIYLLIHMNRGGKV